MSTSQKPVPSEKTGYRLILGAVFVLLFMSALFIPLDVETRHGLLAEGSLLENVTVLGYIICLVLIGVFWPWSKIKTQWYFPALITLFICRELDFDKSQFTVGLLKSRQYVGDLVSTPERLLSLAIIGFILYVIWSIVSKETRNFISGLAARKTSQIAVLIAIFLVFMSKFMDGFGRKMATINIEVSASLEEAAYVLEEVGELGITVMFAIAIVYSRR